MLQNMTAKQFAEWEIYARLEPFSELRADYRAASIVQMIANVNRSPKHKAFTVEDFLLRFETAAKPARKQPWEEQLMWAKIIATAHNKGVKEAEAS